jgi:hypothetical protein
MNSTLPVGEGPGRVLSGTVTEQRRRILIAVEPRMLEGALAAWIEASEDAEVVQFHEVTPEEAAGCDAGVVTIELPDELRPDVVIVLPDSEGNAGMGRVEDHGEVIDLRIESTQHVLDLLHEHRHGRDTSPD